MAAFNIYQSLGAFRGDFEFGKTDCCQLARHVIKDRFGSDLGARFDYMDEEGAEDLMDKYGGVEGVVTEALGFPPHPTNYHESDPVLLDLNNMALIGIVVRDNVAVMAKHGLVLVKACLIVGGWCLCHSL